MCLAGYAAGVTAERHPTLDVFETLLGSGPILLSGGFGTELQRRGVDTRLPLWAAGALLDDPAAVRQVHAEYLAAGADVITANTFRTDPHAVAASGRGVDAAALTRIAVELAREAVEAMRPDRPVLLAGSVGPVRECYAPEAVPEESRLRDEHGARIEALVASGVDLLLVETMNTVREAVTALAAARGRLPALVSFVCGAGGRLLSGEPLGEAVQAVAPYDPLALLVTCCAPAVATEGLEALLGATTLPVGVYANGGGRPADPDGWAFGGGVDDRAYVEAARTWLSRGARLLGGCCGTSPRTIASLRRMLAEIDRS